MFTTDNHFIAQLVASLNRAGWSIQNGYALCTEPQRGHRFIRLEHADGRHVEGLLVDHGEAGYRLYLDQDVITHAEVIEHVEYCASDHLPLVQAARS